MNINLPIAILSLMLALNLAGCSDSSDRSNLIQDDDDTITNTPAEPEDTVDADTLEGLETPDDTNTEIDSVVDTMAIINDQNYTSILTKLLPLIDGTTTDGTADAVISVAYARISNAEFEGTKPEGFTATNTSFDVASGTEFSEYDCDAGGSLVSGQMLARTGVVFDMCIVDNGIYNGTASADFQRDTTTYTFSGFTITAASGNTSLEGIIETQRFRSGSAFFDTLQLADLTTAELPGILLTDYQSSIGGSVNTDSVDSTQTGAIVTRTLSSSFTVYADFTGGAESPMTVNTTTDFIGVQPDPFYVAGTLTATASDGSLLELDADNGDPDTFQVNVTATNVTTSYTLPWDEDYRLRCIDQTNDATPSVFQYDCSD